MIGYGIAWIVALLFLAFVLIGASGIVAQEGRMDEDIATCLNPGYDVRLFVRSLDLTIWLDWDLWTEMHLLGGIDRINAANPAGYDVPDDSRPFLWINANDMHDATLMMVWVWLSEENPHSAYWFLFNPGEPGEDGHPHPCGVFEVSYRKTLDWINRRLED